MDEMGGPTFSNEKTQSARRRLLAVSPEFILALCAQGWKIDFNECLEVEQGIPEDVRFVTGYFDHSKEWFCIVIEHPSFDEIKSGEPMPQQVVTFRKSWKEKELT